MSFFNKLKEHQKKSDEQANLGLHTLLKGEWGLAKTFWLYWFLLTMFIEVFYLFVEKQFHILMLDAAAIYVCITAFIGVKNTLTAKNKGWWLAALVLIGFTLILSVASLSLTLF